MATVDLKLGTTLVSTYDGSPENLDSFVDAVLLFKDTVENAFPATITEPQREAANQTVLRFVRTRLTGKARQVINENQDLEQTLNTVKEQCASKISAENLIAKLSAVKQKENITHFCEQVEKITAQLKSVYLKDNIPEPTANKMATKQGVDALIKGAKSGEIKTILKAGSFSHINDAIQKLQENADQSSDEKLNNAQIFYSTRGGTQGRGRYSHYRGNQRGFQSNNRGRGSNNNYRGNHNNYRGNANRGNGRGNFQNRGSFSQRGQFYPNYGMYCTQNIPMQYQVQQHYPQLQQQQLQQPPSNNIHPLGVSFGQHTQ